MNNMLNAQNIYNIQIPLPWTSNTVNVTLTHQPTAGGTFVTQTVAQPN
jgi:hypothetical protein